MSAFLLVALLAFAGCGGDSSSDSTASSAGEEDTAAGSGSAVPVGTEPKMTAPSGPPPTKLEVKDLREGTGPAVKKGDNIAANYVGMVYKTGKVFESSWKNGAPIEFQLGVGYVIPGWDQGIVGMKAGGLRELTIPPELAYGPEGSGPIPPNSTLVFDVELVSIN